MERITRQRQQEIFAESERDFALFLQHRAEVREKLERKERNRIYAEMEEFQARIHNIMRKAGFDPNQPRVPSGNPDGGQWTAVSGGSGSSGRSRLKPNRDKSPSFEKPDDEDSLWDAIANEFDNSAEAAEISDTHYIEVDGSVKPIPERWARPSEFARHYDDHRNDFASTSGEDYVNKSQAFLKRGLREEASLMIVMTHKKWVKIYEYETRTFGVYSPEGKTETFYKPDRHNNFENDLKDVLAKGGRVVKYSSGGGGGIIGVPGFKPRDNIPDDGLLE